ncbi:MAG: hypothetical protein LBH58_14145 [Tannerellaceae bacterium]|jgi:hypothetical protein|nr:hypothetical protein [Tannerellaceae bacterium]
MKILNLFLSLGMIIVLASCGASKKNASKTALETNQDRRSALLTNFEKSATGAAVKEAKKLQEDNYRAFAGDLPIEKQLENAWIKIIDVSAEGYPAYIVGSAQVTAANATAAKSQAMHAAKLEIAGLISSMIASLIESSVANNEVSNDEAQTLNKHLQASKELVVAELEQVNKDFEVYRELPNKNIQVITRLSYSSTQAIEVGRRKLQKQMEGETEDLHRKLDSIFYLDRLQVGENTNVRLEEE